MNNRRSLLAAIFVVAIVFLVFVIFSDNQGSPAERDTKILVGIGTTPPYAPLIIAKEKGFFSQNGLDVGFVKFSSGKEAVTALLSGSLDAAGAADPPVALSIINGEKIVLLDGLVGGSNHVKFIGKKDKIQNPKDIEGKTVAVFLATGAEYFMDRFFEEYDIDRGKVQIINLKPGEMPIALLRGDIDGYFCWEPNIWNAQKELKDSAVIFQSREYNENLYLIAKTDNVLQNRDKFARFKNATMNAMDFMSSSRDESIKIVSNYISMDYSDLNAIWDSYKFDSTLDENWLKKLDLVIEWAKQKSDITGEFRTEDYVLE